MNEIFLSLIIISLLCFLIGKICSEKENKEPTVTPKETTYHFSPDYENPKARYIWDKESYKFIKK